MDADLHVRHRGLTRVGPVTTTIAVIGSAATVTVALGLAVTRADATAPTRTPLHPTLGSTATSTANDLPAATPPATSSPSGRAATMSPSAPSKRSASGVAHGRPHRQHASSGGS